LELKGVEAKDQNVRTGIEESVVVQVIQLLYPNRLWMVGKKRPLR
jgi:hypothetical protein